MSSRVEFYVDRYDLAGRVVRGYGPFGDRAVAERVAKCAVEKYPGSTVVVVPVWVGG